jgi:glycosyltransferase involved in cell wall biosynthesis
MNIAIDISYVQRRRAGYGRFTLEILKALLSEKTIDHYILHGWSYSLDLAALREFAINKQVRLNAARIPGPLKRFYWNSLRFPSIDFFTGPCDVFHSVEPLLPPAGKCKTIATVHDLSYKKFPNLFNQGVIVWDRHIRRSLKVADAIVTPSQNTKADVVEMFGLDSEKIHVVHPPVSSIFTPGRGMAEPILRKYGITQPYVLFAGTLEPRKNIPFLIKSFERFCDKIHENVQLVLVGKRGWLYEGILKAIRESPRAIDIKYLDYLPEADLAAIYSSALFFVYPSLYEGYGFPVLEAMSSGVPVITSRNSSMLELAEGAALLIDPTNVEEMVDCMEKLYSDAEMRREFSMKGIERVKGFSAASAARSVFKIYDLLR